MGRKSQTEICYVCDAHKYDKNIYANGVAGVWLEIQLNYICIDSIQFEIRKKINNKQIKCILRRTPNTSRISHQRNV